MRRSITIASFAAVFLIAIGCQTTSPQARERQWREGDIIYYTDGRHYENSVSVALPHYHVRNGKYYETHEPSALHYHATRSETGPRQYVKCFAEHKDGQWVHKPQWWELWKNKYRDHDRRW